MGLDMYFTRGPKAKSSKDTQRYTSEVGYFRKHNALHGWLVDNAQGGVDECQCVELSHELLTKLSSLLETALQTRTDTLFPPVGGFFFGHTDVDDWYWEKMTRADETIKDIINTTDFETESVYYQSCW
jgi:hypothetical protein